MISQLELVNIDERLKEIWDNEQGLNRIRAAFFTLIIYTSQEHALAYQKLMQSVILKFPCRVIWIKEEKKGEPYLKTNVRSEAVASNVFCEIIELEGCGSFMERIPFIVLPYIISDLPLYLLWTEEPEVDNKVFSFFAPLARKIILDPTMIENYPKYFKGALEFIKTYPNKVSDLAWNSLKSWRQLLVSLFDTEESINSFQNCDEITISYCANPKSKNKIAILYFQMWMATLLDAQFQSMKKDQHEWQFKYSGKMKEITITCLPFPGADYQTLPPILPPNSLMSLEIEGCTDHGHYIFKRNQNTRQVFFQFSDKNCCELPHCQYLSGMTEGQEIIEEFFFQTENTNYRKILEKVEQISWPPV